MSPTPKDLTLPPSPETLGSEVTVRYCAGCRWLLRAAYYAQELLATFENQIGGVTLQPDHSTPGGVFEIHVSGRRVWSRTEDGGFPEVKELKRRVRDQLDPDRPLGHIDRNAGHACPLDDDNQTTRQP
ncbi:MAG: SelT/SelW/SelH family protein [Planctomycetota bacterium]